MMQPHEFEPSANETFQVVGYEENRYKGGYAVYDSRKPWGDPAIVKTFPETPAGRAAAAQHDDANDDHHQRKQEQQLLPVQGLADRRAECCADDA